MQFAACNATITDNELCTPQTCCLAQGSVNYLPTLPGNALYLAIYAALLVAQLGFGIFYRTWGFMVAMGLGLITEIIGYIGRVMMHNNIFAQNPFLVYIVCLTIAPAFLTAAIYLCLGRIVVVHGTQYSFFRPGTYTQIFVTCDVMSLILQAAGGAVTSIADPGDPLQQSGINIMIAGLAFQVASLGLFMIMSADFGRRVITAQRRGEQHGEMLFYGLRKSGRFIGFQAALAIATVLIFIRCIYRVAELNQGFNGSLANNEVVFMILEGPMVIIAVGALTVFHPGWSFKGQFGDANFSFGHKKDAQRRMARSGQSETEMDLYNAKKPEPVESQGQF